MLCKIQKISVAEFEDSRTLMRALISFRKTRGKFHADLYEYLGKYRLVIHSPANLRLDFSGKKSTYLEFFKTVEYGDLILSSC